MHHSPVNTTYAPNSVVDSAQSQPIASTSTGGAMGEHLQTSATPDVKVNVRLVKEINSLSLQDKNARLIDGVKRSNTEVVKLLIEAGANLDQAEIDGLTPLYWAAYNGHTEVVKLLIEAGANIDQADIYGRTPLYWAATYYYTEVVKLLIEAGANIDQADIDGRTPLYCTVDSYFHCYTEVVKLLIKAGANIDQADIDGRTPLHRAAACRRPELVKLLIGAGANVDQADKDGETPFSRMRELFTEDVLNEMLTLKPECPYERGFPSYLSLVNMCRKQIRGLIHTCGGFNELPLPQVIKDYLLVKQQASE